MTRQGSTVTVAWSVCWFVAWLIMGLPPLHRWDAALVSLLVCLGLDGRKALACSSD